MPNWRKICPSKVTTTFLGAGFSNSLSCCAIFQQSCQHNHGTHVKQEMATFWTTQELCFWGVPIYPIIYLGQDIMPLSIVTKCHEDLIKTWLKKLEHLAAHYGCSHNTSDFSKGHNSDWAWKLEIGWYTNLCQQNIWSTDRLSKDSSTVPLQFHSSSKTSYFLSFNLFLL